MRRTHFLALTTAIAIAGFCFVSPVSGQTDQPANPPGADSQVKGATDTNPKTPDFSGIRRTLATATEAAMTKGGFDDLVERFVDADRNRIGQSGITKQDQPTLDGRVAQFQKDWKAKYNQDFNIKDKDTVFNDSFAMIKEGEIPGNARLAGERVGKDAAGNKDSDRPGGGDTNREPGRNVAYATIPASHGLPELQVPLIHEMGGWKIDVPDNVTGEQLRDNLLKHLTMADDDKANWPSDVNDAYRAVSHHVLAAIFNADAKTGSDMDRTNQPGTGR
jgi:hypothetical protein